MPRGWWHDEARPFAVVVTPISKYGVIMYMSAAGANSKVYLYKHAQISAPTKVAEKK